MYSGQIDLSHSTGTDLLSNPIVGHHRAVGQGYERLRVVVIVFHVHFTTYFPV